MVQQATKEELWGHQLVRHGPQGRFGRVCRPGEHLSSKRGAGRFLPAWRVGGIWFDALGGFPNLSPLGFA